jgi:hypothetical protein
MHEFIFPLRTARLPSVIPAKYHRFVKKSSYVNEEERGNGAQA